VQRLLVGLGLGLGPRTKFTVDQTGNELEAIVHAAALAGGRPSPLPRRMI
jgi:hypothetical protein